MSHGIRLAPPEGQLHFGLYEVWQSTKRWVSVYGWLTLVVHEVYKEVVVSLHLLYPSESDYNVSTTM